MSAEKPNDLHSKKISLLISLNTFTFFFLIYYIVWKEILFFFFVKMKDRFRVINKYLINPLEFPNFLPYLSLEVAVVGSLSIWRYMSLPIYYIHT